MWERQTARLSGGGKLRDPADRSVAFQYVTTAEGKFIETMEASSSEFSEHQEATDRRNS